MNRSKKPLYEALVDHAQKNPISFHVPGHKYGSISPGNNYFRELLKIDATELSGLDDLHAPEGPIKEAMELLANLYQVKKSFFLVNGSTAGNLAMIMSVCEEGQRVLVQRNCHKSILNALKLANANPVFLDPDYDFDWKIAAEVSYETVKKALSLYPDAKGLILTYPNYYGMAYDIERIIELAHRKGIPVLVDEAHGPHFIIGEPFPPSSLTQGADMAVQSAHKTLPAMTMGSFLHFNSNFINLNKVMEYLHIFQSSSPSYPIMASLDIARDYLQEYQPRDAAYLLTVKENYKKELNEIPGIRVLEYADIGDPLKVTIQSTCGASGFFLQKRLEDSGVYPELADPYNVLFVLPLLKESQEYPFQDALVKIKRALKNIPLYPKKPVWPVENHKISTLAVPYRLMEKLEEMDIPISRASGEIAAENIIPYPPGIPLLLKGEKITEDSLSVLKRLMEDGARFQGGTKLQQNKIRIFRTT